MRPEKINLGIVKFCAEEVERQNRGPLQVWNMVEAWDYAINRQKAFAAHPLAMIQTLGFLVEPTKNMAGAWRSVDVVIGNHQAPHPSELQQLMNEWLEDLDQKYPGEAYLTFQQHHPFLDGNGRVGKIIYNWLKGTLDAPELPPDFFNCYNP